EALLLKTSVSEEMLPHTHLVIGFTIGGQIRFIDSARRGEIYVAPTEEIPMLATASTGPSLLGMVALSLAASYAIVYVAGFGDQQRRREQKGIFQHPVTETVVSYILALVSAGFMLWFFRNLSAPASWSTALSEVVVLGLPAAVGGAAGRLAA
ncbi:MAG: DUF2391 family protein, partial [Actinobacteria bacterium]|nr:DUF2391 family protein [Actinomycetota bacterium]